MSDEILEDAVDFTEDEDKERDKFELKYYYADGFIATISDTQPSDPTVQPISREELLIAQISDYNCSEIRHCLNRG